MITEDTIERRIDEVARALATLAGAGGGARHWTLSPHATRGDVLLMTRRYGIDHLFELRDVLVELSRCHPEAVNRIVRAETIIDFNAGAGLGGLALACVGASAKGVAPVVRFVDHAPAALEVALELAASLGIPASGHLVVKAHSDAAPFDPDATSTIADARLVSSLPAVSGASVVFAGHALNCWRFDQNPESARRQSNLEAQNARILQEIAAQLDRAAFTTIVQVDVGASNALRIRWLADEIDKTATRAREAVEMRVVNRTGRENALPKYGATMELAPVPGPIDAQADEWIVFQTMVGDILLTAGEFDVLLGEPQVGESLCDTDELDLMLMAGRS